MNDIIVGYEERLRLAMLSGDVEEADKLFSDSLIFVNHLGQLISKMMIYPRKNRRKNKGVLR